MNNPFLLFNDDCLDALQILGDQSVDMVLCDLPYGTSACKWDSVIPLVPLWKEYVRVIRPDGAVVLTASQPFTTVLAHSGINLLKYSLVWEKTKANGFFDVKFRPLKTHEDILVFGQGGVSTGSGIPMKYFPQGVVECEPRKRSRKGLSSTVRSITEPVGEQTQTNWPKSILKFPSEGKTDHPTQKPVALMEYLIRTYTMEGDTVLDNTMGSGTTGVACANTKRRFIGMEKDKEHGYFEIAKRRVEEAYGIPQDDY